MTQNRRIVLNIVATYGRSLYALILGLFTARWALQALGQMDYGLFGLVGGMIGFVSFFNNLLTSAVGRFYAVSIGASRNENGFVCGLEDCRKWFNTALSIHTIVPVFLLIIGYPIGLWAIEHFLSIPSNRVVACVWVWRVTCISCFFSMLNVPFNSMYTAKQDIAELTIYGFVTTTLNACILGYMVAHPGVWLAKFAALTCLVSVSIQIVMGIRSFYKYPECRFERKYLWSKERYILLGKFAFARFWSQASSMFSSQAHSILVNKFMGPIYNAAMTVGNAVGGHAITLSSAISNAFWPAVANLAGEGKLDEMKKMCFMTCRLSSIMVLIFAIPLSLEIDEILHLWLVTPPPFANIICILFLFRFAFERMTSGHWMAVLGTGNGILKYSWWVGWSGISAVFATTLGFFIGWGMWSVCVGLIVSKAVDVTVRLVLCRSLVGFSCRYWVQHVLLPVVLLTVITFFIGAFPQFVMGASLLRVIVTTVACVMTFSLGIWCVVLEAQEKRMIREKILKRIPIVRRVC